MRFHLGGRLFVGLMTAGLLAVCILVAALVRGAHAHDHSWIVGSIASDPRAVAHAAPMATAPHSQTSIGNPGMVTTAFA